MYSCIHCAGEQTCTWVYYKLATKYTQSSCFNFFVLSAKEVFLGWVCMEFQELYNGANFIFIAHWVGELLAINRMSIKHDSPIHSYPLQCTASLQNVDNARVKDLAVKYNEYEYDQYQVYFSGWSDSQTTQFRYFI